MKINTIEQSVIEQESYKKKKIENALKKVFEDEGTTKRLKGRVIGIAAQEGFSIDEQYVDNIMENIWDYIGDEFEYTPGYVDDYISEIKWKFFNGSKLSLEQVAQYIFECSIN